MKKRISFGLVMLMFIFIVSFSSALDDYPEQDVGVEFTFCQTCEDATYITLSSIQTPNSTEIIAQNMTATGAGDFCYNYTPQLPGRYDFRGISDGCLNTFATYVDVDKPNIVADIILLFFFFGIALWTYIASHKIDFDKWHNAMLNKYNGKNTPKIVLYSIGYTIMKDNFILYYLLGWPVLIIIMDIVSSFGMTAISGIIDSIFVIYAIGIAVVGLLFFGKLQEMVMKIIKELKKMTWGVE